MILDDAKQYANDIINGKIQAAQTTILACQRFLNDLNNERYYYDPKDVEAFNLFCNSLKHFTGKFAGQSFELSPYQKFFIANILGLKNKETGLRKYRNVYLQIGRKNGKTSLIAALSLYFLILDGEANAEVIVVANSVEQARINLSTTVNYALSIDPNKKLLIPQYSKIKYGNSKVQIRASDSTKLDGLNTSVCILDEFHEGEKTTLDVLKSGQGARLQPLSIIITTAGLDLSKYCYQLYKNYKQQLLNNTVLDEDFVLIYELEDVDYVNDNYMTNSACWVKANPNLNISLNEAFIREQINSIKQDYSNRISVLTKNFNVWVDAAATVDNSEKYIDDDIILGCMQDIDLKDFSGCWAFAAVDLSSVADLNVLTLLIPKDGQFFFKNFFFLPKENTNIKNTKHKFSVWNREGYIELTEGNCLDSDSIVSKIKWIVNTYNINIVELHLDVYNSTSFQLKMAQECPEIPIFPFSQSFLNFNKPTKELKILVLKNQVIIDKNSITRWNFHNAVVKETSNGNVKCLKLNNYNQNKIDSVISMQMAFGGYLSSNYVYTMN